MHEERSLEDLLAEELPTGRWGDAPDSPPRLAALAAVRRAPVTDMQAWENYNALADAIDAPHRAVPPVTDAVASHPPRDSAGPETFSSRIGQALELVAVWLIRMYRDVRTGTLIVTVASLVPAVPAPPILACPGFIPA